MLHLDRHLLAAHVVRGAWELAESGVRVLGLAPLVACADLQVDLIVFGAEVAQELSAALVTAVARLNGTLVTFVGFGAFGTRDGAEERLQLRMLAACVGLQVALVSIQR